MALIPPFFLDCVVAIGLLASNGTKEWVASGFLFGEFVERKSPTEATYRVYLVTNRHVFEGLQTAYVRFNPEANEPAREFDLQLHDPDGKLKWVAHPDHTIDIAITPINVALLKEQHIKFSWFQGDQHVMDRKKANELGLSEGDGVYVLGFPMGLVGGERNYVIVRQGTIARIRDALAGSSKEFLIDSTIFPGNSGGPVVTRPEITAIQGTQSSSAAHLIGVVKAYIPYRELAISAQTKQPRIMFEENSSLASIIPIDFVRETIEEYLKTQKAN